MLADITNHPSTGPSSDCSDQDLRVETNVNNKRWVGEDGDLLPSKLRAKRRFDSSSSSPARSSSPSIFANTRFEAYDAPSSPLPPSFPLTSPSKQTPELVVLAPSSPSAVPSSPTPHSEELANVEALDASDDADEPLTLRLERGTIMQFGRKAKKTTPNRSETTLPILLPRSAKNASRLHCTVRILPRQMGVIDHRLVVEVRVLGQNGMKVEGKLWKCGSVAVLPVVAGRMLTLSFWGWNSTVIVAESEVVFKEPKKVKRVVVRAITPPTDHDDGFNSLFDGSSDVERHLVESQLIPAATTTRESSRASSPALSDVSALSILSSSPAPSHRQLDDDVDATEAEELAESLQLDLPGLIASAIVFQPRSTVGVEEVIRALLKEVGGMWGVVDGGRGPAEEEREREDEAVEAWWDVIESVLRNEVFFGCIENAGLKDAAGNQLSQAYYYLPESDPSPSRVEALEPFVKRVRGARTQGGGKRYFWRRPSMRKNR